MTSRTSLGFGLIDSLIAIFVVCVGMLAVFALHLNSNRAAVALRERAAAMQLASSAAERERAAADPAAGIEVAAASAAYAVQTRAEGTQRLVSVRWQDRSGAPQGVELDTRIEAADSAGLALLAYAAPPQVLLPSLRHPAIPPGATVRRPGASRIDGAGLAFGYRVDDATGVVEARCTKEARDERCEPLAALLVSGYIRYGPGVPALALQPRNPLRIRATDAAPAPRAVECSVAPVEAPDERYLAYTCIVVPDPATRRWSGELVLEPSGWSLADYEIRRIGHAAQPVDSSLDQQNFLIARPGTIGPP